MSELNPMYVLTVKRDGGTQDVKKFYGRHELMDALDDCRQFLVDSTYSRRAIIRLEWYNPQGAETGATE